jgi:hypothetical protein
MIITLSEKQKEYLRGHEEAEKIIKARISDYINAILDGVGELPKDIIGVKFNGSDLELTVPEPEVKLRLEK